MGVITISRGCFERCCSNKKTPPYTHSNLGFVTLRNRRPTLLRVSAYRTPSEASPRRRCGHANRLSLDHTLRMDKCIHRVAGRRLRHLSAAHSLAFTKYNFTSSRLCTKQTSFSFSCLPELPTLLRYYCTTIAQYTTHPRPPFCMPYTIQHW